LTLLISNRLQSDPTATRMMNVSGRTSQCRCRPIRCCQTSMESPNAPA